MYDEDNHGKMYPPEDILDEQNEFLTKSGCFRAKSNIKHARSRFQFGDPGEGAFVGSSGIAKNTELFYSGLIFFGYYDEDKMLQLWKTTFKENLPPKWENKVYQVERTIWIIGSPSQWTSFLNSNQIHSLCHAIIVVPDVGLIQFSNAAFSFDEVLLSYSNRLSMTAHSPPNLPGQTKPKQTSVTIA